MPDPVRLFSAGSLRHALPAIIAASGKAGGAPVSLTLGPAGILRERIEMGEAFDLFVSADMGHPQRLASIGMTGAPVCLARNRLCLLARADLGLTDTNLLTVLSNSSVRIGTSTPGTDPCGDYAARMFALIEERHPGAGAGLTSRACQLLGGRGTPSGKDGATLIAEGAVDVFVGYFSTARQYAGDQAFSLVEIPARWAPRVEYGLAMRTGASDAAGAFRAFLLSGPARELLREAGFGPPSEG